MRSFSMTCITIFKFQNYNNNNEQNWHTPAQTGQQIQRREIGEFLRLNFGIISQNTVINVSASLRLRYALDDQSLDAIQNPSINQLTHLCTQLKYIEKLKNQSESNSLQLSNHIEKVVNSLRNKNQEFPKIKQMKSQNKGQLSPILEMYSQQNLLSNYLRKNSHHRSNKYSNLSELQKYSETLNANSQVYREQTRRSLDVSRQKQKKPLYTELQKLKTKQPNATTFRIYHEPRKYSVKSKLPQYNISKLI